MHRLLLILVRHHSRVTHDFEPLTGRTTGFGSNSLKFGSTVWRLAAQFTSHESNEDVSYRLITPHRTRYRTESITLAPCVSPIAEAEGTSRPHHVEPSLACPNGVFDGEPRFAAETGRPFASPPADESEPEGNRDATVLLPGGRSPVVFRAPNRQTCRAKRMDAPDRESMSLPAVSRAFQPRLSRRLASVQRKSTQRGRSVEEVPQPDAAQPQPDAQGPHRDESVRAVGPQPGRCSDGLNLSICHIRQSKQTTLPVLLGSTASRPDDVSAWSGWLGRRITSLAGPNGGLPHPVGAQRDVALVATSARV